MSGFKTILPAQPAKDDVLETPETITSSTGSSATTPGDLTVAGSSRIREEEKPKRKRKAPAKVAIVACLECRRTRSKCDGEAPHPCARCRTRGSRCVYQPHTKIQKDEILNDLEQERARAESLSQRNDDLSLILEVISNNGHLEEIVQRLRRKEEAKTIASWLSTLPELQSSLRKKPLDTTETEAVVESLKTIYSIESHDQNSTEQPRVRWTRVTSDIGFVDYLVKLYLTCVHPDSMLFNEMAFAKSYRTGNNSACSKALLNAICAMACNALDRRRIGGEQDAANIAHLHNAFHLEARSSITLADSQDITSIQAMAILFLADLSSGKARSASFYLKCASENLRSLEADAVFTPDFDLSRWGVHSLDTISCVYSYANPFSPQSIDTSVSFTSNQELFEEVSLGTEPLLHKTPEQSSLAIKIAGVRARLCQLVHGMIGLYGGSDGRIEPEAILTFFQTYTQLFESIPEFVRLSEGRKLGVDIRSLHIKYHSMIAAFWLPLLSFSHDQEYNDMFNTSRHYMLDSCRKGVSMVNGSLQDQSCELLLPHYVFCVVNICDLAARWTTDPNEQLDALHICFKFLDRNMLNFKLCGLLKKLVRTECEKFVDSKMMEDLKKQYELHDPCTIDEALDATTRLTYMTRFSSATTWLDPDFQRQWTEAWNAVTSPSSSSARTSSTGTTHAMRLKNICD